MSRSDLYKVPGTSALQKGGMETCLSLILQLGPPVAASSKVPHRDQRLISTPAFCCLVLAKGICESAFGVQKLLAVHMISTCYCSPFSYLNQLISDC